MKRFASVLALALVAALPGAALAKRHATPPPAAAAAPASVSCAAGDPGVWVNLSTKVYHLPGSSYYGKTKSGKYLCKSDADKAGDRVAKAEGAPKRGAAAAAPTTAPMTSSKKHHRRSGAGEMPAASPTPGAM